MNRPHTITIYNKYNDKYFKCVLNDVYFYGTDSINISGKGIAESNFINIIIDGVNLFKYVDKEQYVGKKDTFTLQNNIRIILGNGPDINNLSEIEGFRQITVFSYDVNVVGSPVDNILIGGR